MNDTIRLLYAEDNPLDADLTRAHFEREAPGFCVEIAETGARCLARLAAEPFDLLLLDYRLPDMDGLDVLGRLRAGGQTLPVVMVTGVGDDETVAKALRAGAADYVPKSEGYLATLPDLLRGVLARQRSSRLLGSDGVPRVQRILYVEHNPMDVELTASHFAAAAPHLQLQAVASSLEALALLAPGHGFDLVLTDLRMPDMNALEFTREAQHRGIDLPFVVITGKGDEATAVAILRLGAYDYIVKRDNYLMQLPHAIDHALQRFRHDQTMRRLRAELEALNASLEQKVENRTAELLQEMEMRRASEEKFRKITESAQDAIIMMGPDGNILFWNHAAELIFGYTADEAMGQDLHALIATEQAQAEFAHGFPSFQKSGTGPIIGSVREVTGLRKNGEEVPLEISISAMQLKGKWHAIGILRDISERKRAAHALYESEKLYHSLFENMLNGLAYCQMLFEQDQPQDFVYLSVNAAFEAQTGLKNVVGKKVSEVIPGIRQSDPELFEVYGRVALSGKPERLEIYLTAMQQWFWLSVYSPKAGYFVAVFDVITERKQAEDALRKLKDLLQSVIENTPIHIFWKDRDSRYLGCNTLFAKSAGYSALEEVAGKTDFGMAWKDHAESYRADDKAVMESGIPKLNYEEPFTTPDGKLAWARTSKVPLRDERNQVVGILGIYEDITARKQGEAALKESERVKSELLEKLKEAQHLAIIGSWEWDLQTNHVWWSDETYQIFGVTPQEYVPSFEANGKFIHPDDFEKYNKSFEHSLQTGEPLDLEIRLIANDGLLKHCHAKGKIIYGDSGQQVRFIGTIMDITVHKQAEDALRESESRFRNTFEQAAVGIAHVAPDGRWLRVNQRLCDIVGYTREELLAATFQDITHPDDLELDLNYVRQVLAGEIPIYSLEKRYFHKNGEIIWINLTVALVRRADGNPDYFISVVEDITERKRAEKESHLMLAMGKIIAEAESFTSALEISIRTICESTGWDYCEVWIPSHDGTYLELADPYCCMDGGLEDFRSASKEFRFASGTGLPGRVAASGKPVWIQDVTADANFRRAAIARQAGIRVAAAIPILSEGKGVAVMVFFMRKERVEDARTIGLISAIATQLGTAFQRKRDAEQIQRLANFDALTGLPNRVLLTDRISQSLSMAQRNREQLAAMFLDLDHFKNINDTLGHRIGDALLIEVAKRLRSAMREEDTVSRLGGDEFILVLPGTDVDGAARAAKKLLEVIGQPYRIEQHELAVTPSIGIAMYPTDSEDFESLAKNADAAMYRAKAEGRNGYCFFTQEMQEHTTRNLKLEYALRYALERNQLQLHYQPQVALQGGAIVGAEALLRWQHPELGMISPAEFIPVAEASGQIIQIGEWVLRSVARQLRAWMDSGLAPMTVAVNLSAVQFRHARLPDLVTQILDEAKLPPQCIELELTESVAMGDPLAAIAVMRNMHERGVRMSIDDFGTGYSSLSYLKHFKVHRLKIDQSFVRDITEDPDDRAIVAAIINLASALGIQTIAEGVETEEQLTFLRENGCNEMQGYYYSKPLPVEQFEAFVRGHH